MSGWVCSYRTMWDHPMFKGNAMRVGVWHWILHRAAWRPTRFKVGGQIITLERGQVCLSYRQVCDETGMSMKAFRTFLTELVREGAATQDTAQGRTILTISNYDKYQAKESDEGTANGTPRAQQGHTKEQDNNKTIPPPEEAHASSPVQVSVVTTAMWSAGKQYLASHSVKNPGGMIGRWLKESDPLTILNAIEMAQRAGTQDPIPYITQVLKGSNDDQFTPRKTHGNDPDSDPTLRAIFGAAGAF